MSGKRFTAAQARELAGPTVDERVDAALETIRAAAEKKQRKCSLTSEFWVNGGYGSGSKIHEDYKTACKILEDLGFKVWFFYEERQFVDMYTVVEW